MSKLMEEFNRLPPLSEKENHRQADKDEAAHRARFDLALKALCIGADQLGELVMQLRLLNNGRKAGGS